MNHVCWRIWIFNQDNPYWEPSKYEYLLFFFPAIPLQKIAQDKSIFIYSLMSITTYLINRERHLWYIYIFFFYCFASFWEWRFYSTLPLQEVYRLRLLCRDKLWSYNNASKRNSLARFKGEYKNPVRNIKPSGYIHLLNLL